MRHAKNSAPERPETLSPHGTVIGRIVDVSPGGIPRVDFPGNEAGPIRARSALPAPQPGASAPLTGAAVALAFENQDPSLPVIVGLVRDTLFPPLSVAGASSLPERLVVDADAVRLEAREEIVLSCGESAIVLREDGRIVVRGVEITTRATRTNKIKGGRVRIN